MEKKSSEFKKAGGAVGLAVQDLDKRVSTIEGRSSFAFRKRKRKK